MALERLIIYLRDPDDAAIAAELLKEDKVKMTYFLLIEAVAKDEEIRRIKALFKATGIKEYLIT